VRSSLICGVHNNTYIHSHIVNSDFIFVFIVALVIIVIVTFNLNNTPYIYVIMFRTILCLNESLRPLQYHTQLELGTYKIILFILFGNN